MIDIHKVYLFAKAAAKDLLKHKVRSFLSVLGIVIGISSVIMIIGLSNSSNTVIVERIFTYGENAARVRVSDNKQITDNDLRRIKKSVPHLRYFTPVFRSSAVITYASTSLNVRIEAGSSDYIEMDGWTFAQGRSFDEYEVGSYMPVVVLGSRVRQDLFPARNAIGNYITINGIKFEIIGVLQSRGKTLAGRDSDNMVIVPYTTFSRIIANTNRYNTIQLSVVDGLYENQMIDILRDYFRRKHNLLPGEPDDFEIITTSEKIALSKTISGLLAILTIVIGSISLIVGGVGIMNIMLAAVSERVREIGIRIAIGAKPQDILLQFLMESVILCFTGGVIGVTIGLVLYVIITFFLKWPVEISYVAIFVSTIFSSFVGVIFGMYPSWKAASLKPIEALKNE